MNEYSHTSLVDKPNQELQFLTNVIEETLKWMLRILVVTGSPFIISLLIQFCFL